MRFDSTTASAGGRMAEIHDFSRLYRQLGLEPGCSLRELRMAYRRRVARLHPDRDRDQEYGDGQILQQLNILYGAALDFQRHMGRLPGTPNHKPDSGERHPVAAVSPPPATQNKPPPSHDDAAPTRLRTLATLLLVLLLAAIFWAAANQSLPWAGGG